MEWWGYSSERGWVFLDREILCNKPNGSPQLLFVQCNNCEMFMEERKRWEPPIYVFEGRFLQSLQEEVRAQLAAELQGYKEDIETLRQTAREGWKKLEAAKLDAAGDWGTNFEWLAGLYETLTPEQRIEKAIAAHGQFLGARGKPNLGYVKRTIPARRRVTHCYRCKKSLDNAIDVECKACGWIICGCGACGCGWDNGCGF